MTPQPRQATKLLRLSSLDLRSEAQQAVESNPLLEFEDMPGAGPGEAAYKTYGGAARRTDANPDLQARADISPTASAADHTDLQTHGPRDGEFGDGYWRSGADRPKDYEASVDNNAQAEDSREPLSDGRLTRLPEREGIKAARRTAAKYRQRLNIPPSHQRRSRAAAF